MSTICFKCGREIKGKEHLIYDIGLGIEYYLCSRCEGRMEVRIWK